MNPRVDIRRECYSMSKKNSVAEIMMYGQIVRRRPVDWWTDKPVEGKYIILDEFVDDLKELSGAKEILIHLDSLGGDAYAALTIHNKLREMKARKTIRVDGVAMSGGAMIMCAASGLNDTVQINPGSLVMIHKCITPLMGYYNADEMDSISESSKAMDRSQAAIYKAKCGLEEDELLDMMAKTTTLTGEEAVEKGFADELIAGAEPVELAASADKRTLFINGRALNMSGLSVPDSIPVAPDADASDDIDAYAPDIIGGNESMTIEELKTQHAELVEQIMAEAKVTADAEADTRIKEAVMAERARIQEIDEISALYDDETLMHAKYVEPRTAQEMTFQAAKDAAKDGKKHLKDMQTDTQASGTGQVNAAPAPNDETKELTPEERRAQGRADAKALKEE